MICTGSGKFFSNGVDLERMIGGDPEDMKLFWRQYQTLIMRILCLPMPTVAAINGKNQTFFRV